MGSIPVSAIKGALSEANDEAPFPRLEALLFFGLFSTPFWPLLFHNNWAREKEPLVEDGELG